MTDFDTICNNSSPPLADIVRFGSLRIVVSLTVLKRVYYGEGLALFQPLPRTVYD